MKWEVWISLFDDHLIAYNLSTVDERRKLAILRSSLGAEGFRICKDLCPEANISYADTIQRLEQRFAPAPSRILARAQFNRRVQQPDEDCAQFATALRALASKCGYLEATVLELVRDRVVAGCCDEKIRERLLQEPDTLTLDGALALAQRLERASIENKAVTEPATPVVDRVYFRSNNNSNRGTLSQRRCYNCGDQGHLKFDPSCPARGKTCNNCGRTGHLARVCRSGQQPQPYKNPRNSLKPQSNDSSSTSKNRSAVDSDTSVGVILMSSKPGSRLLKRLVCTVAGTEIELLVDTGAVASILNYSTFRSLRQLPDLKESNVNLISYTGQAIYVIGHAKVTVIYGKLRVFDFNFIIVDKGDNIMGIDLFNAFGFTIQLEKQRLCKIEAVSDQGSDDILSRYPNLLQPPATIKQFVHRPAIDRTVLPRSQPYPSSANCT